MTVAANSAVDRSAVPAVWARYTDLVIDRGEGSWLITTDGERYLDYSTGIGVTNTGHAHPRVVAAIQAQAAKLLHAQQNIVFHEAGLRLHERLAHAAAGGRRAVAGVPLEQRRRGGRGVGQACARRDGRPAIVAFRGGFHGRTGQAMALTTSRVSVRGRFEPLPGSVYHAPFPYCYRASAGAHSPDDCRCDWEQGLGDLFAQMVDPRASPRSSSSRCSARAATSCRPPSSCRGCARSPTSTGSCSSPTRSRPASGAPGASSRWSTPA